MTNPTKRDIEKRLDELQEQRGGDAERIHVIGFGEDADSGYLTPEEYEERYGHPPEESPGLVIHVPEASTEF